jgi:multidrug resistance efflux pump
MNYERVRAELLQIRSELAIAKVNVAMASNQVHRNTPLYREKLVSEDIWDLSVKTRDAFQAEVEEKTKAVQEMEGRLTQLRSLGDPEASVSDPRITALLTRLEATQSVVSSNFGPITLVAPISGMVSAIIRQPGEYVLDGEQLLSVHSLWSERVVGYLRQPYPVEPAKGMSVQLTTRDKKRQQVWAEITQVGAQVEVITNVLAFVRQGALVDVGLPIVINLPHEARIRPGEIVDVYVKPTPTRVVDPRVN